MAETVLETLNGLSDGAAREQLARCCGSSAWCRRLAARRPFASRAALHEAADEVFSSLSRVDWLEAFSHHPRLGATCDGGTGARWSAAEQAGAASAGEGIRRRLAEGNDRYAERFGHVFLICATGLSAPEMLDALERRLENDPDTEITLAAEAQRAIMHLRLDKLLDELP